MTQRARLVFALAFPIACLAGLAAYKQVRVTIGTRVVIPIAGFDPRDLLSGHYLTYRLDLGEGGSAICTPPLSPTLSPAGGEGAVDTLVCGRLKQGVLVSAWRLDPARFSPPGKAAGCDAVLRGKCEGNRFLAGVERFYVPEEHAAALERAVQSRLGEVVLSVDPFGRAAVKDLLVDGKPWREAIRERGR